MKRQLLTKLLQWKEAPTRKPLLIQGARQVGKSYLLTTLLADHYPKTHYIDLMATRSAHSIFEGDLDPNTIHASLETTLNTRINPETELIIFDEIGECPNAIKSLKFFAEQQPTWNIATSGSTIGLLESFPVGKVNGHTLRPMNFAEFVNAVGSDIQKELLEQTTITAAAHQQLWKLLTDFLFVGGMPEAVLQWKNSTRSGHEAEEQVKSVQRNILEGFERDFGKYGGKVSALHLNQVFSSVPKQLSYDLDDTTNRYKFKDVIPKRRSFRDFERIIDWLERTQLVSKNYPVATAQTPLAIHSQQNRFKLFFLDIGLLGQSLGIEGRILDRTDAPYKGPILENFVQNELLALGLTHTYSWDSNNKAEIEFLLEAPDTVVPLEVKSGRKSRARSLASYIKRYQPPRALKLVAQQGGDKPADGLYKLPAYFLSAAYKWATKPASTEI